MTTESNSYLEEIRQGDCIPKITWESSSRDGRLQCELFLMVVPDDVEGLFQPK